MIWNIVNSLCRCFTEMKVSVLLIVGMLLSVNTVFWIAGVTFFYPSLLDSVPMDDAKLSTCPNLNSATYVCK